MLSSAGLQIAQSSFTLDDDDWGAIIAGGIILGVGILSALAGGSGGSRHRTIAEEKKPAEKKENAALPTDIHGSRVYPGLGNYGNGEIVGAWGGKATYSKGEIWAWNGKFIATYSDEADFEWRAKRLLQDWYHWFS